MPNERDMVIKISRILLDDTLCIVNEIDISTTQYLVQICYARLKGKLKGKQRSQECVHTKRLCHAVKWLVLRRNTKEQKLLRQVTHKKSNLSYATRLNSRIQRERIWPRLYTSWFSSIQADFPKVWIIWNKIFGKS